jgi:hypothetical protein
MSFSVPHPNQQQVERESEDWMRECARQNGLDGWQDQHPDLGFAKKIDFKLERSGEAALFEVKAFTTMRTWEDGFAAMAANGGQITAFYVKHEGRSVLAQARRARDKFVEHRALQLPAVTVFANPGNADVSLNIEGLLIPLYGDPVFDIQSERSGIRLNPSMWTADNVTSAFIVLEGPRAARVLHTPAAIERRCPRLDPSWFSQAEQWEWDVPAQSFVIR